MKFSIPTKEEIRLFFTENSLPTDPDVFFDYYDRKGWTWGKEHKPMASEDDWHKAARFFKPHRAQTLYNEYLSLAGDNPVTEAVFNAIIAASEYPPEVIRKNLVHVVNLERHCDIVAELESGIKAFAAEYHYEESKDDISRIYWAYVNEGKGKNPFQFAYDFLKTTTINKNI